MSRPSTVAVAVASATLLGGCLPGAIGSQLIFKAERHPVRHEPAIAHEEVSFAGDGVVIRGWLYRAAAPRRGTIIFLHGRNQNRESSIPAAARLVSAGYDVLAYDSRGHGESTGSYTTFGYYEKSDIRRAIDWLGTDHVIVMGVSLGGAVALQAAAEDPRIEGVIAVSSFTTLQQIVRDQIPGIVPSPWVRGTVRNAASRIHLPVDDVDTVEAARRIRARVLLLHGADDRFTAPEHSRRIAAALAGPHQLVLVEGAHHANVLSYTQAWIAIWRWLGIASDAQIAAAPHR